MGYLFVYKPCYPLKTLLIIPYPNLNHPISWSRIILDCSRMILSYIKVICAFLKNLGLKSLPMFPFRTTNSAPPPREFASGKCYKMSSIQNSQVLCMKLGDGVQSWMQGSVDLKPRSLDLECNTPVNQLSRQRKHGKYIFPIAIVPLSANPSSIKMLQFLQRITVFKYRIHCRYNS